MRTTYVARVLLVLTATLAPTAAPAGWWGTTQFGD